MFKHVLLVDPDEEALRMLSEASGAVHLERCVDFRSARIRLFEVHPDLLVTNLRLGAHNGLHLVLLAAAATPRIRSVVYMDAPEDLVLARIAQRAGAFYETTWRLPSVLSAYAHAHLPDRDRRDPSVFDRRHMFRGGRRSVDLALASG